MDGRLLGRALVAAFSLSLAYFAWQAFGPPIAPEYVIQSRGPSLGSAEPDSRKLYLRRTLYLAEQPESAWLTVMARDWVQLFVNGRFVATQRRNGGSAAILADLSSHLRSGRNVIAITTDQPTGRVPPVVAVEGGYVLRDQHHELGVDDQWRYATAFERTNAYWFSTLFDDLHWPAAALRDVELRSTVRDPPDSLRPRGAPRWISPVRSENDMAVLRREFSLGRRPRAGWIRVLADSPYRIAVNGSVIDAQERYLASDLRTPPAARIYDLSPYLRWGRNVVALAVNGSAGSPIVQISGEVRDGATRLLPLDADDRWVESAGLPRDWMQRRIDDPAAWRPCSAGSGHRVGSPGTVESRFGKPEIPATLRVTRWLAILGLAAVIAILTLFVCRRAARLLSTALLPHASGAPVTAVYLFLLPTILLSVCAHLAAFDARIAQADVYRGIWLLLLFGIVPLQWWLFALIVRRRRAVDGPGAPRFREAAVWGVLTVLLLTGFFLRVRDIGERPLHPDEVTVYRATQGVFEHGFPGFRINPDLPVSHAATSELIFVGTTIAELFFDRDYLVVRAPGAILGTLTILLIFVVGRTMFSVSVGLVAATWYTLAPSTIDMSNFGRYFSQLQFLVLLTALVLYLTLQGSGKLNRTWLWATALCFSATFLSWEGVVMLAPGLVLAALALRGKHLRSILTDVAVWAAMGSVLLVALLQHAHRGFQQSQRLTFGTGASDVALTPMWRHAIFDPYYYIWTASWTEDALLPVIGLLVAGLLALTHAWRRPTRFLLLVLLSNCSLMALLLPVRAARYGYHLLPLMILLAAAALVAVARGLVSGGLRLWPEKPPRTWALYARGSGALVVACGLALGSGVAIKIPELGFRGGINAVTSPGHQSAADYVRRHLQDGDIILANVPHALDHYLGRPTDYWPETRLHLQAILDDRREVPLHRLTGTEKISTEEGLKDVLGRHRRVWFVAVPNMNRLMNKPSVSRYLRANMDVVYEGPFCLVLLKGGQHRSTAQQMQDELELERAGASYLP